MAQNVVSVSVTEQREGKEREELTGVERIGGHLLSASWERFDFPAALGSETGALQKLVLVLERVVVQHGKVAVE